MPYRTKKVNDKNRNNNDSLDKIDCKGPETELHAVLHANLVTDFRCNLYCFSLKCNLSCKQLGPNSVVTIY